MRSRVSCWAALLCALPAVGCGTLATGDGGDENLPSRGIVPFDKLAPAEGDTESILPFVLADESLVLDEPSAVVDGGLVLLFTQASEGDSSAIVLARSPDGRAFDAAAEVFAAELAWEEGWVGAPSVLTGTGGFLMWYVGGRSEPAIGLARSADGVSWTRESDPVLRPQADERLAAPSVVRLGGALVMFVLSETPGDEPDSTRTAILRAESDDGVSWAPVGEVLTTEVGCREADGRLIRCWDEGYVGSAGARVSTSPAGRQLVDLWYTGGISAESAIGFAGSYDGAEFRRYALNPVVDDDTPEAAPAVIEYRGTLLMYYSDALDERRAIGLAINR